MTEFFCFIYILYILNYNKFNKLFIFLHIIFIYLCEKKGHMLSCIFQLIIIRNIIIFFMKVA